MNANPPTQPNWPIFTTQPQPGIPQITPSSVSTPAMPLPTPQMPTMKQTPQGIQVGSFPPIDPTFALGAEGQAAKEAVGATDILKDALIHNLQQGAPNLGAALDTKLAQESQDLLQYLKEQKNPTLQHMNRGLELLRLQGHNVEPIVKQILDTSEQAMTKAQKQHTQLRNALGRYTSRMVPKK